MYTSIQYDAATLTIHVLSAGDDSTVVIIVKH